LKKKQNLPLFFGLSHIGQVFSLCWAKKISKSAVFDFDKERYLQFKKNIFTKEEPNLSKLNKKKIIFLRDKNEIKKYNTIFFTLDTPLNEILGKPNPQYIENNLVSLFKMKSKNSIVYLTSQVYPGFIDYLKKKYMKIDFSNLIYMVDTLKMGVAVKRFLLPEQLVFGGDAKHFKKIKKTFKFFRCKKYILTAKEAELLKLSINLNLFFNVTYANIVDTFSKELGVNYNKIIPNLRKDKRIGLYSYIEPSVAISGGHLERDSYYLKKFINNENCKNIISEMIKFNYARIKILEIFKKYIKKKLVKVLIVGSSYKKDSYSMVNSVFRNLIKKKEYVTYFYDDIFFMKKNKQYNIIKNLKKINTFDVIIYNYSNKKNLFKILNVIKSNEKIFFLNINSSINLLIENFTKLNFKNNFNIKNIF
jgi:UDPglucose 6-dehydrogenase